MSSDVGSKTVPLGRVAGALALQAGVMTAAGLGLWYWSGRAPGSFVTVTMEELARGVALGLALIVLALVLWRAFPKAGETLVRLQAHTYAAIGSRLSWPFIVAVSICAGVGEEALFRGGLQTLLGDHTGAAGGIAISSALFAAIHLSKPPITALIFAIGALFGAIYWLSGSLLTVMIGHALYDVWALKYLHSEFVRLGLVGEEAPLANPASRG